MTGRLPAELRAKALPFSPHKAAGMVAFLPVRVFVAVYCPAKIRRLRLTAHKSPHMVQVSASIGLEEARYALAFSGSMASSNMRVQSSSRRVLFMALF